MVDETISIIETLIPSVPETLGSSHLIFYQVDSCNWVCSSIKNAYLFLSLKFGNKKKQTVLKKIDKSDLIIR